MTDPSPTERLPLPDAGDPFATGSTPTPPPDAGPPPSEPPRPASSVPPAAWPPPATDTWRRPVSADPDRGGALLFGVILLGVGLWFFAERTLGLAMPDISWGQLWPLLLVGLGAWMVLGTLRRGR